MKHWEDFKEGKKKSYKREDKNKEADVIMKMNVKTQTCCWQVNKSLTEQVGSIIWK